MNCGCVCYFCCLSVCIYIYMFFFYSVLVIRSQMVIISISSHIDRSIRFISLAHLISIRRVYLHIFQHACTHIKISCLVLSCCVFFSSGVGSIVVWYYFFPFDTYRYIDMYYKPTNKYLCRCFSFSISLLCRYRCIFSRFSLESIWILIVSRILYSGVYYVIFSVSL